VTALSRLSDVALELSVVLAQSKGYIVSTTGGTMDTHHNQIGSFSADEVAVLEAGRAGVRTLKKTIEIWFSIGRAVQVIRKQADVLGGRNAFERLMEQEGFSLAKYGKRGLFQPATITRLLQIMQPDNFTRVVAWHEGLPDHHKIAWASPDSVFKHCPVFGKARPASTAKPKAKTHEKQAQGAELIPKPDEQIDPASLSMTAQQKLEAYRRQIERKLDIEFEYRVREELKRHLDDVALPSYLKEIAALERSIRDRRGIMDRVTYRKILACLHVERLIQLLNISITELDPALKKRFDEAFTLFTELEKRVLNEKESPTTFRKMPSTYEELMAAREKVGARNSERAKRAAATRAAAKGSGK
jgi:hypothetical protein